MNNGQNFKFVFACDEPIFITRNPNEMIYLPKNCFITKDFSVLKGSKMVEDYLFDMKEVSFYDIKLI